MNKTRGGSAEIHPAGARRQSRTLILDAALKLFGENSVRQTSMEDIATLAGVTRRTVYRYFPSKQAIVIAVVERNSERVLAELGQTVDDNLPLQDFIAESILFILAHAPAEPFFRNFQWAETRIQGADFIRVFEHTVNHWVDLFRKPYIRALRERTVNPELELGDIVMWVGRICLSYLMYPLPGQDPELIRKDIKLLFTNALRVGA